MAVWTFWLILAVSFLIIELFTQSLTCLYVGVGALCAMTYSIFYHGWGESILVLTVATAIFWLSTMRLRRRMLAFLHKSADTTATGMDALVGRVGIVDVTDRPRMKIDGDYWQVRLPKSSAVSLRHGDRVKVVSFDSAVLEVEIIAQ